MHEEKRQATAAVRTAGPVPDQAERFVIRTPFAGFCGTRAGCRFHDGVSYTNDEARAAECRGLGYTVEDRRPPPAKPAKG